MVQADSVTSDVLETGVPNLDRILGGGLLRRCTAIVIGAPGTGKTLLAHQMAFYGAVRGASVLYLTGYSETHDKLLSYGRGLSFFNLDIIGRRIHYGSLPDLLREGPDETEDAIVSTARAQRSSLVVLDGFRSMRGFLSSGNAAAHFLYSLGAKLALLGATTLVILEGDPDDSANYPELTVCDVILALRRQRQDNGQRRLLEVVKSRGSQSLAGVHPFSITQDGLAVFPRFESTLNVCEPAWSPGQAGFGIAPLDALLYGGPSIGTCTLTAGSPGMGKTLLGLHFTAAGVAAGEPCLFLGFMESRAQLHEKARVFGMDLETAEANGVVRFLAQPAYDLEADAIAEVMRRDIEQRGVRRLVIDSAKELGRAVRSQERIPNFMSALVAYLRERRVTTYLTIDIPTVVGPVLEFADTPLSVLAENLLLLRQVAYRNHLHRLLSVLKMRFSDYERSIHEYAIVGGQGIQILGLAPPGEALLTGSAHPVPDLLATSQPGESQGGPWPQS